MEYVGTIPYGGGVKMIEWSREQRYKKLEEVTAMELQKLKQNVKVCPFRQKFHIQPPTGLLNDPNGFTSRIFPSKWSQGIKFFADGESKLSADIWDIN